MGQSAMDKVFVSLKSKEVQKRDGGSFVATEGNIRKEKLLDLLQGCGEWVKIRLKDSKYEDSQFYLEVVDGSRFAKKQDDAQDAADAARNAFFNEQQDVDL